MLRRLGQLRLAKGCLHNRTPLAQPIRRHLTTETENAAENTVKEVYRPRQRKFGVGTALLCIVPFFTFGLGTWQVQRLRWKTHLIETLEDRLERDPIPLPKRIK